jgi:hypothetical protein
LIFYEYPEISGPEPVICRPPSTPNPAFHETPDRKILESGAFFAPAALSNPCVRQETDSYFRHSALQRPGIIKQDVSLIFQA